MQVMAHAMSHILADNGKTVLLHQCLNRCADIADPMAGLRRLNTQIQAFLRYVQKLLGLFADLPHRKGKRIVSVESADTGAHINACLLYTSNGKLPAGSGYPRQKQKKKLLPSHWLIEKQQIWQRY